ncbi:MAG: Vmc-like lipoprotein signal peptide domain-containing protein [Cycloclasticus sp.]
MAISSLCRNRSAVVNASLSLGTFLLLASIATSASACSNTFCAWAFASCSLSDSEMAERFLG